MEHIHFNPAERGVFDSEYMTALCADNVLDLPQKPLVWSRADNGAKSEAVAPARDGAALLWCARLRRQRCSLWQPSGVQVSATPLTPAVPLAGRESVAVGEPLFALLGRGGAATPPVVGMFDAQNNRSANARSIRVFMVQSRRA
jgi:hypothetical protein